MNFICTNGKFLPADVPVLTSSNRGFRYGDGLFETMKVYNRQILFDSLHFERLFTGIRMLGMDAVFTADELSAAALELCEKNKCSHLARLRLAVYREDNNTASYLIETFSLSPSCMEWNKQGFDITIFPFARKSVDAYSNLKTANFLPYVLAEKYAAQNGFDDALVLNASSHLCDSSKANLFLIKNGTLFTPALHQGCINGVIRRQLIDLLKAKHYEVHQSEITGDQLLDADEAFLTNSIFDIRWIASFKNKTYSCEQTRSIYNEVFNFY